MEWGIIVALVIGIPIILFPAAFVWHLVIGALPASGPMKRIAYAALFFLVGIFFPLLIWVALGVAVKRWVRERVLLRPRTVGQILAAAGLMIHWETPGAESLTTAVFIKQPISEIRELLARAGL